MSTEGKRRYPADTYPTTDTDSDAPAMRLVSERKVTYRVTRERSGTVTIYDSRGNPQDVAPLRWVRKRTTVTERITKRFVEVDEE